MGGECKFHTQWQQVHISKSIFLHILLFFPGIPGLGAVRSVCCRGDGVNWWALLAGRIGGMGGMRKTGPGLASVVVKLHQTEDQVCRHKLKLIRWVCDNVTGKRGKEEVGLVCRYKNQSRVLSEAPTYSLAFPFPSLCTNFSSHSIQ